MPLLTRKAWLIGHSTRKIFRPSKDRIYRLMRAICITESSIQETYSMDIRNGEIRYNMKFHELAMTFVVQVPEGRERLFEEIYGEEGVLEVPPKISLN